jgi:hypothetical protein
MIKKTALGIFLTYAVQVCFAQVSVKSVQEEHIAKLLISTSEVRDLYPYNVNIGFFLTTALGNLEYGPQGVLTYIHETMHVDDNTRNLSTDPKRYYRFDASEFMTVDIRDGFFTSDNIFPLLPAYVRDSSMASMAQTYLLCQNSCLSRIYGIYGLLEEFDAYSLEPSCLLDFHSFFDTCGYTNTTKFWAGYYNSKGNSWNDFYYFNIFFAAYLKYADSHRKTFYDQLITDTAFKYAFSKIYHRFTESLIALDRIDRETAPAMRNQANYPFAFQEASDNLKKLNDSDDTRKYVERLLVDLP